jgi:cell division protein FtsQ
MLLSGTLLLLIIPIALAVYWIASIGLRPLTQITINGELQHVHPNQLKALITPQTERGYFGMDVDALRHSLLEIPWIDTASVRRHWPNGLEVDLQEHEPQARWRSGELLSTTGQRFRPPPKTMPDGLPWLDGPSDSEARVLEHYHQFAELLATTGLGIYALTVDRRGTWKLILDNRLELLLGRERTAARLWRLAQVYTAMVKPRANQIQRIDLRYSNGFALSWRGDKPSVR